MLSATTIPMTFAGPVATAVTSLIYNRIASGEPRGCKVTGSETAEFVTLSAQFDAPVPGPLGFAARVKGSDAPLRRAFAGVMGTWDNLAVLCFAIDSTGGCTDIENVPQGTPEWNAIVNAVLDAR